MAVSKILGVIIQDYYCCISRKSGRSKKRFQEGEVDLKHNMKGY